MKKIIIIIMAVVLLPNVVSASDGYTALNVILRDGTTATVQLMNEPRVRIIDGNLEIKTYLSTIEYPMSSVSRFVFTGNDGTSVNGVYQQDGKLSQDGDAVTIHGCKVGETFVVHSSDGKVLFQKTASGTDNVVLSLQSLPSGIYFVKSASGTFKILKP